MSALRVGLYARVATHDQQTLPMQLSTMRDYAKSRKWAAALESRTLDQEPLPARSVRSSSGSTPDNLPRAAWLVPKSEAFPRSFRLTVTARLLAAALDLPEILLDAQSRRERLVQADATLNKLRLSLRLAHQWHWLSSGQYEHVSRMVGRNRQTPRRLAPAAGWQQ